MQTKNEIHNLQTESKNIVIHQDLERAIENKTEFVNEVHIAKAVLCMFLKSTETISYTMSI